MMDTKEAIHGVGTILIDFLKSGPSSPGHIEEIKSQISKIALSLVTSPEEATENYKEACKDFLDKVIAVKGMPIRVIGGVNQSEIASYGEHATENFDSLLPKINSRYNWCIENYKRQSKIYLNEQLAQFHDLLLEFLKQVPIGGTKDKLTKSKIAEIKSELRCLTKWTQLFYTYKAISLSAEIKHVFALEGNVIAARWCYSQSDEQGEYQKTYNHKEQAGRMYAVRGNWAIENGLMKVGPNGYIDEISLPNQEIGCMCNFVYLHSPRELTEDMLTAKGKAWINAKDDTRRAISGSANIK